MSTLAGTIDVTGAAVTLTHGGINAAGKEESGTRRRSQRMDARLCRARAGRVDLQSAAQGAFAEVTEESGTSNRNASLSHLPSASQCARL
jgi:hypothetical protein